MRRYEHLTNAAQKIVSILEDISEKVDTYTSPFRKQCSNCAFFQPNVRYQDRFGRCIRGIGARYVDEDKVHTVSDSGTISVVEARDPYELNKTHYVGRRFGCIHFSRRTQ